MAILQSRLDVRSETYKKNREHMLDKLAFLEELYAKAAEGGGKERVERLASRGKIAIRERISWALDQDSPFLEISPLAAWRSPYVIGSGFVAGIGVIEDVECVVLGHDPSVRAGAFNAFNSKKLMRGLEIARENRLPYVQFVESAGADLGTGDGARSRDANADPLLRETGHFAESGRLFYEISELSKLRIPTVSIAFGASTAGGAYQPGMSDYNIFVKKQAMVALGSPPLVKMATGEDAHPENLGGAAMHTAVSGLGDYLAEDEMDGIRICREIVRHLNWQKHGPGPSMSSDRPIYDPDELLGIVGEDLSVPFDMREVIARIVDGSRFEEFKPRYGPTLVTGWASIHGYPIGILGNNGPLMSESSEKAAQFIQLCNQVDVSLLFLHNITGYVVGAEFEQSGITKNGSKMINAVTNSTVPHFSVIVGASYGAGNYGMSGRAYGTRFTYTWPTAKIAVMGPKQQAGVMSIVRRNATERAGKKFDEDSNRKRVESAEHWLEERSKGLFASSRVTDDAMLDPRDTREALGFSISVSHNKAVKGTKEFGTWRM